MSQKDDKRDKSINILSEFDKFWQSGRKVGPDECRAVIVACEGYSLALWKPAKLFPNIIVFFAVGIASSCHNLPESLGKQ